MYLQFFNLKKEPFQITPDPSFLYLSRGHEQALASIIYGVEKRKGFVLIIGAVGVGKTTILRAYLEKVEKETLKTIYLFNSNISYNNLLKHMLREFGVHPVSDENCDLVNQLYQILLEEYQQGRNVLLLIDEAQNMPVDTLENLRMLSNLETSNEKLLQIVFSAQPEFEKTMNLEELKQLKQRVALKAVIFPLTQKEGLTYIHHRLKRAADRESVIFTPYALREIVRIAKGIPRVINVLCDNSLITAFGYGKEKVGIAVVREITRDFGMQRPPYLRWAALTTAVGVLLTVGGFFGLKNKGILPEAKPVVKMQPVKLRGKAVTTATPISSTVEVGKAAPGGDGTEVVRMVAKGDTLAKLIKDVYGYVNPRIIRAVKNANPEIDNENLIIEGGRIVFPAQKRK
jgi:general secretion pathway protein A